MDRSANIVTDAHLSYEGLDRHFHSHHVVDHSETFVRGIIFHTNFAESYHSLLKRGIIGSFHHVSDKHLHRYLAEFDYRWNTRKDRDGDRTLETLKAAPGKRLTYRTGTNPNALRPGSQIDPGAGLQLYARWCPRSDSNRHLPCERPIPDRMCLPCSTTGALGGRAVTRPSRSQMVPQRGCEVYRVVRPECTPEEVRLRRFYLSHLLPSGHDTGGVGRRWPLRLFPFGIADQEPTAILDPIKLPFKAAQLDTGRGWRNPRIEPCSPFSNLACS